ncbi:MAG TPA: hydroxymethylbilane synthase [Gemmatimonadales bacterium]|nr:hydroxymethylbilane synthase [Gemmatimonadales bacterium]
MSAPLRIGTRSSALALWQTERVRALLAERGIRTERIEIKTTGDVVLDRPLSQIGSKALFTKQLDDAMLEGRIDAAVHSLKDLPTLMPEGLALAAVGLRADPRDALVGRGPMRWQDIPPNATVATSSLRRRAQLLRARPDLTIDDIRGNVDTRLGKLDRSETWSAIMLASAGLDRLGFGARIGERLPFDVMLPAPGQGALAVTVRDDDARSADLVRSVVHDVGVALAVSAERGFLNRLEGGCQVPVAAHADVEGSTVRLHGRVVSLDGHRMAEGHHVGSATDVASAAAVGALLAERLLEEGAHEILAAIRPAPVPEP